MNGISSRLKFSQELKGTPTIIQFAKDYNFKNAWRIKPSTGVSQRDINNYLDPKSYSNICVEYFAKDSTDRIVVFGFSNSPNTRCPDDRDFIRLCLDKAATHNIFDRFISSIESSLLGKEGVMYQNTPDMIRVGIIDYWFDTGPCLIWSNGEPKEISIDSINRKLSKYPEIHDTQLNIQGISFLYSMNRFGIEHWIMWQCGEKKKGRFIIDPERISTLLMSLLDFETQ